MSKSQTDLILAHLESGRTITPLEALNLFSCFRLGARIFEIKRMGYNITSRMVELNNGKHVAEYSLAEEVEAAA